MPPGLFCRCGNTVSGEILCNLSRGFSSKVLIVNPSDNHSLLNHLHVTGVGTFLVPKEVAVGQANNTVGEAFALSPGCVLTDELAFFLGKAGHDGDE